MVSGIAGSLRSFVWRIGPALDLVLWPFTLLSAVFLLLLRKAGIGHLPFSRKVLFGVGVFPITNHYYDPMFNPRRLRDMAGHERIVPGIDFNAQEQLTALHRFRYNSELSAFPREPQRAGLQYYYRNGQFGPGDAEYYYNMIRHYKPRKIVEIGAGYSTLMAVNALAANGREAASGPGELVCVEPFERPWLKRLPITLIRQRVEEVDKKLFRELEADDILFIDSSHVIRPRGDVLCEVLEMLPILRPGVIVHVHDVFTPRDYPAHFRMHTEVSFFNEQYLIEAFLSYNSQYKVVGALNWLYHNHRGELLGKCPLLTEEPSEPGSLWMMRV